MKCPAQGATGGWVMLGLVLKWSRDYQRLQDSAPTPKAQGLISGQEQRFHKWFIMALSEVKTNIQKRVTKDEPQTNGSCKIRHIIKVMEYTLIHIHP